MRSSCYPRRTPSMVNVLATCLITLLQAVAVLGTPAGPALGPTANMKHWTLQIDVPTNCPMPEVPVANATALVACAVPCNTTGSTAYDVRKGDDITVGFQARPGVVIIGGSQNLRFMNDLVVDMKVMTASAPANPITPITFTGFEFAPKENYYAMFQAGVLGKLAVYAFDATRPSHNKSDGLLGMYETASCRTSIDLRLISPPPNVTVGASQLFTQAHNQEMEQRQGKKMTAIVVPAVIGGFVAAVALGCLALGLAKKGAAVKA